MMTTNKTIISKSNKIESKNQQKAHVVDAHFDKYKGQAHDISVKIETALEQDCKELVKAIESYWRDSTDKQFWSLTYADHRAMFSEKEIKYNVEGMCTQTVALFSELLSKFPNQVFIINKILDFFAETRLILSSANYYHFLSILTICVRNPHFDLENTPFFLKKIHLLFQDGCEKYEREARSAVDITHIPELTAEERKNQYVLMHLQMVETLFEIHSKLCKKSLQNCVSWLETLEYITVLLTKIYGDKKLSSHSFFKSYLDYIRFSAQLERPHLEGVFMSFLAIKKLNFFKDPQQGLVVQRQIRWALFSAVTNFLKSSLSKNPKFEFEKRDLLHITFLLEETKFLELSVQDTYFWRHLVNYLTLTAHLPRDFVESKVPNLYHHAHEILNLTQTVANETILDPTFEIIFDRLFYIFSISPHPDIREMISLYERIQLRGQHNVNKIMLNYVFSVLAKIPTPEPDCLIYFYTEGLRLDYFTNPDTQQRSLAYIFTAFHNASTTNPQIALWFFNLARENQCLTNPTYNKILTILNEATVSFDISSEEDHIIQNELPFCNRLTTFIEEQQTKWRQHNSLFPRIIQKFLTEIQYIQDDMERLPAEKYAELDMLTKQIEQLDAKGKANCEYDVTAMTLDLKYDNKYWNVRLDLGVLSAIQAEFDAEIEQCKSNAMHASVSPIQTAKEAWPILSTNNIEQIELLKSRLSKFLKENPDDYHAHIAKLKCLIKLGITDAASKVIFNINAKFSKVHDVEFLEYWAICCKELGQYLSAIEVYERMLTCHLSLGKRFKIEGFLANCYVLVGDAQSTEKAVLIYQNLLLKAAHNESIRINCHKGIARCMITQGKLSEAIHYLQRVPEWEENPSLLLLIAETMFKRGKFTETLNYCKQIINHHQKTRFTMHSLTLLLTKLALQIDVTHVTATIKDKEECYTENTKAALMYKANIFKLKKNYDASLEIYLQVLSTWGKNQHIYSQIAYCYLKLSRISEAITWLESFLLYKKNRSIYLLLAQCYQHAGDHQQAGEAYNTLLQEYPGYGSAYISAISYYISLNEAEEVSRYHKQFFTYCAEYKDRARVTAMVKRYQSMTSQEQAKNPPILEEFLETDLTQDEFNEENYDEHFPNTLNAKNDHFSVDYRQSCSDAKISEISMFTARHAKSDRGMTDMRPLADSTCITVVPGVGFSNKPGVV